MRRFTRDDARDFAKLGAIFLAFGFVFGLFVGEPLLGMVAGALLFAMMVVVGGLATLF